MGYINMERIFIEGYSDRQRNELIHEVEKTIAENGGWIMDHQMFSNKSISLWVVTDYLKLGKMFNDLKLIQVNMNSERLDTILGNNHPIEDPEPIMLSLSINFINHYPDLAVKTPPIS